MINNNGMNNSRIISFYFTNIKTQFIIINKAQQELSLKSMIYNAGFKDY